MVELNSVLLPCSWTTAPYTTSYNLKFIRINGSLNWFIICEPKQISHVMRSGLVSSVAIVVIKTSTFISSYITEDIKWHMKIEMEVNGNVITRSLWKWLSWIVSVGRGCSRVYCEQLKRPRTAGWGRAGGGRPLDNNTHTNKITICVDTSALESALKMIDSLIS